MNHRLLALAAMLVVTLAAVLVVRAGGADHTLRVSFDSAVQVVPGQQVRIGGRSVGHVAEVRQVGGDAELDLAITDDASWPQHRGTTARLRWGSNTSYASRYVELQPGAAKAPALPDGGVIPRAATTAPVELDDVYRLFRGRGRADLGALVDELGETFNGAAAPLASAVRETPRGLNAAAAILRELGDDPDALRMLVVSGDRVTAALADREPALRAAIDRAAGTFDAVAGQADALRAAIDRLPATLHDGRGALRDLDASLSGLDDLVTDLRPGAAALRTLAPVARGAISELRDVAPLATDTLRRGTSAAGPLTRLLAAGRPLMPRVTTVLDRLEPMLGCLRPYGPEIAGFASTWTAFNKNYDAQGHVARAFVQAPPVPVGSPLTTAQAVGIHPGALFYAMPRPPGFNAGTPWLQPQCGAGADALDPRKDPETTQGGR